MSSERSYKVKNHQYGIIRYNKKKKKICIQIILRSANCIKAHTTNFPHFTSKHKVEISAKKEKIGKKIQKKKEIGSNTGNKIGKKEKKASL